SYHAWSLGVTNSPIIQRDPRCDCRNVLCWSRTLHSGPKGDEGTWTDTSRAGRRPMPPAHPRVSGGSSPLAGRSGHSSWGGRRASSKPTFVGISPSASAQLGKWPGDDATALADHLADHPSRFALRWLFGGG